MFAKPVKSRLWYVFAAYSLNNVECLVVADFMKPESPHCMNDAHIFELCQHVSCKNVDVKKYVSWNNYKLFKGLLST